MKKCRICTAVVIAVLVAVFLVGATAGNAVIINAIASKHPGDSVTLSGTHEFDEITVKVLRPNDTILYVNVLKSRTFSDTFTLPGDTANGTYKVIAGKDEEVAVTTFTVTARREDNSGTPSMTVPKTGTTKVFKDIESYSWAREAIETLTDLGVIEGTSDTTYSPGSNITRADFLTLLARLLKFEADFTANFDDISPSEHYYEAVGMARALGITDGVGNNQFNPLANITREDMMVMTVRALRAVGEMRGDVDLTVLSRFKDSDSIASYARDYVAVLVESGIIGGDDGSVASKRNMTRAETAVVLYRLYKKLA